MSSETKIAAETVDLIDPQMTNRTFGLLFCSLTYYNCPMNTRAHISIDRRLPASRPGQIARLPDCQKNFLSARASRLLESIGQKMFPLPTKTSNIISKPSRGAPSLSLLPASNIPESKQIHMIFQISLPISWLYPYCIDIVSILGLSYACHTLVICLYFACHMLVLCLSLFGIFALIQLFLFCFLCIRSLATLPQRYVSVNPSFDRSV